MSFEVAAVHATLGFKVEGAQEAARFTEQVTRAQEAMERAVGSNSAQVQKLANDLQGAVDRLRELQNGSATLEQALNTVGSTLRTMEADIQSVGAAMAEGNARLQEAQAAYDQVNDALRAQRKEVNQAAREHGLLSAQYKEARQIENELIATRKQAREAIKAEGDALVELAQKQQTLNAVRETQEQLPGVLTDQAAEVEVLTGRLDRMVASTTGAAAGMGVATNASRKLGGQMKITQSHISSAISAMQSGRLSATVLAQALQLLTGAAARLTAALAGVSIGAVALAGSIAAAPYLAVLGGWKLLNSEWGQAADRLNALNPEIVAVADNLKGLAGAVPVGAIAGALEQAENRLRSFGISEEQARAISTRIAEAAEVGQFLRPGQGDFAQVFDDIQRSIESLNFDRLRDLGINVNFIEQELERLANQGIGEVELQGHALNLVLGEMAANMDRATEAAAREKGTFAGLTADIRSMWAAAMESEEVRAAIDSLVGSFRSFLPVIAGIVKAVALLVVGFAKLVETILKVVDAVPAAFGVVGLLVKGLQQLGGTQLDDLGVGSLTDDLLSVQNGVDNLFDGVVQGTEKGISAFERFRDSLSGGFSIVSDLKNIGQAFADISDGLDPGEAFTYFEAINRGINNIAEQGTAQVLRSFEVMRAQAQELFNAGIIDKAAFDRTIFEIQKAQDATMPLIAEVDKLEREFDGAKSKAESAGGVLSGTLTPSVQGSGSAAEIAGGQFRGLASDIATAQAVAAKGIHVQITTSSSSVSSGGVGTSTGGAPKSIGGGTKSNAVVAASADKKFLPSTGGSTSSASGELGDKQAAAAAQEAAAAAKAVAEATASFPGAIKDFNDAFGIGSSGGGGGGGGGGGSSAKDEKLASIEEIKEFFNQVNSAILSGIRGGLVFSTAGNAIPLGGPGQFISSQGGTLIETVNLRGVWDFADPAAKREILRQLREALDELGAEVA